MPAWDLPTKRNWMLMHDKQVVVGPIAAWVRETLQNGYSTRYLSAQTAGLYVERGEEKEVRVGCELELDGERLLPPVRSRGQGLGNLRCSLVAYHGL